MTQQTVREWRDKHRIVVDGTEPRRWRIDRDASDQLLDASRNPQQDVVDSADYQAARARRELANAKIAELNEQRLRGELVARAEIEETISEFFTDYRENLLAIPHRESGPLAVEIGCDEVRLSIALERVLIEHLEYIAKRPVPIGEERAAWDAGGDDGEDGEDE